MYQDPADGPSLLAVSAAILAGEIDYRIAYQAKAAGAGQASRAKLSPAKVKEEPREPAGNEDDDDDDDDDDDVATSPRADAETDTAGRGGDNADGLSDEGDPDQKDAENTDARDK